MLRKQLNATLQYACSGHTPCKLVSLIMSTSGFLHRASVASSCDWERDILDMKASRIKALQLALDQQTHWLTPVQLNRSQTWMSPLSPHSAPLALDRFSDGSSNQTACMWLASTKVMNDKYHSPTALLSLQVTASQSVCEDSVLCTVLSSPGLKA